jgi:predicted phosphodiesterase
MPRILHVTDLHYRRHWFDWVSRESRKYDFVVISGDFIDAFPLAKSPLQDQVAWLSGWCRSLPCPLAVCTGNHDVVPADCRGEVAELAGQWLRDLRLPGRIFVDCDDVDFDGLRVVVWPWSGGFSPAPDDRATLSISHAGPAYSGVSQSHVGEFGDVSVDCFLRGLTSTAWSLSGHVHERSSWHDFVGRSRCFNPGVAPWSAPRPNHVVLDAKRRIAALFEWNGDADFVRF